MGELLFLRRSFVFGGVFLCRSLLCGSLFLNRSLSGLERCLLGANAGIGISLGDDCVVEAGLYVTGSTPVLTDDGVVKARELSGASGLMFIRDGQSGSVIARRRKQVWGELNEELHTGQ